MANKIITFQQTEVQKRLQENPLEVFLDVSMNSTQNINMLSIIHIIPPVLQLNYISLKAENEGDGLVQLIADQDDVTEENYTNFLTYAHAYDYDEFVISGESSKYFMNLATDPKSDPSCVITDPADDGMYISILSSDEYNEDTKIEVEQIENISYNVNRLVNVNAIRNSLDNIFTWIPGERVLLPEFGSNLRKLLYEGITDYNVEQIIAEIKQIVSRWEPRVQITSIVDASTIDDHENNTVHIKIIYIIPGLSDAQFEYEYVQPIAEY